MNRHEELAVGRRLFGHIDGRTTDLADALFRNKTVNYSCRERAALERERLFRAVPAFANICRHRGAPVASGCGNARAFTCPYHGWTYDSAGKLLGTTDKVGFAGLDLASHGLVRLPAAERHGMLFVRPKPVQPGESVE